MRDGRRGGVYDAAQLVEHRSVPKRSPNGRQGSQRQLGADISVVDGVNLNMDIVPVGQHSDTPVGPVDSHFWLGAANSPLTKCGGDLRANCPEDFQLRREQLTFFIQGTDGAENVVGCFSNCGQYKFQGQLIGACPMGFRCAGEPEFDCVPDTTTEAGRVCYYWKPFCTAVAEGDPDHIYGRPCSTDSDCPQHGVCWNNGNPQAVCAPSAFNKNPNCPVDVCTNQYSQAISFQPPFSLCSELTDATGRPQDCIGDDTVHEVMPRGLTWPNDPETYYSDAKAFRVVFAPGGTNVPDHRLGRDPRLQYDAGGLPLHGAETVLQHFYQRRCSLRRRQALTQLRQVLFQRQQHSVHGRYRLSAEQRCVLEQLRHRWLQPREPALRFLGVSDRGRRCVERRLV